MQFKASNAISDFRILADSIIGQNIKQGISEPNKLSFSDIKCYKNNRPFDNSTNRFSYRLSCDSSHDSFFDSHSSFLVSCDIMIQRRNGLVDQ